MSHKQALLKFIEALPDAATWGEITDALLVFIARRSGAALTAGQRAELGAKLDSIPGVSPDDVREAVAQIEAGQVVPHVVAFAKSRDRL
jgi:hypothetical protein